MEEDYFYKKELCECGGRIQIRCWDEPITQFEWVWTDEEECEKCGKIERKESKYRKCYYRV